VIGAPVSYRRRPEFEKLIGFFANTLVLRTDLSGNPTFRQLLGRVREVALGAHAHQDLPFPLLVEALRPERSLSRNPIFQVMLALQPSPFVPIELPELTITPASHPIDTGTAKFDLSLSIHESDRELSCLLEYSTDLFESGTVSRLLEHFERFLEQAVDDPERRISEMQLLSENDRRQVLVGWNQTTQPSAESSVHALVEEQARRTPDAIAVFCGKDKINYSELNARANQLAHYLIYRGVGPETLVAVATERGVEMIVALLGVLKAGGAYVPIDPSFPKDRIACIFQDSKVRLVLTQDRLVAELPATDVEKVRLDADWSAIGRESAENPVTNISPGTLAYLIYTSGSTGRPKGVQVEHRAVVNLLTSMKQEPGLEAGDVLLAVTTLSFDIAGLEIFLPLITGATVAVASRDEVVDPEKLLACMRRCGATVMQATPATWRMLLALGWEGDAKLKVLCGGEALPRELADKLLPRCQTLWNLYGPTETTIWSCVHRVRGDENFAVVPIGRPIANTTAYVLDARRKPVPIGVTGELYIGGLGVSRGYFGSPELTSEKFVPDPFGASSNARLYRTGDLASYDPDGNLHFCGRNDTQVKLRGFRIEAAEIETLLTREAAIQSAIVLLREDTPGEPILVAYVVLRPGQDVDLAILGRKLGEFLPEYMVPAGFAVLDALPLTPNGKVNRRELPPPGSLHIPGSAFLATRDEIEAALVRIWEKVLNISGIGVRDNFFQLGGHSLLAVKLISQIRTVIGREIPLASLFQGATIEHLANVLRQTADGLSYPLVMELSTSAQRAGKTSHAKRPFFCVAAPGVNALGYAALARHLDSDQPVYKLQAPRKGKPASLGPRPYTAAEWEGMAAEYILALRAVQAEGPYFLGGMCGGARIAYDMARQLEAEGEKVGLLAIFDTWAFENTQNRMLWKIDYYRNRLLAICRIPLKEQLNTWREILQRRVGSELNPQPLLWAAANWPGPDFVPRTYPGRITLFKLSRQPFYRVRDPQLGWGSRALRGVDVHVVHMRSAGSHMELFREPLVAKLAQMLTDTLLRDSAPEPEDAVCAGVQSNVV
jgi:amino acid adenylation domain-containing protein